MPTPDDDYELVSVGELIARYQLTDVKPSVPQLVRQRIPQNLWRLIPYAELWGVTDDTLRGMLLRKATPQALRELKEVVSAADDALDEWLAGPEADAPAQSDEYIAFSAMRMAA